MKQGGILMGETSSSYPGVLLRFRNGTVQVYSCTDPLQDLNEPQQAGDVDLFKINHSVFCANAVHIQKYFDLQSSTLNRLLTPGCRSEFHCMDHYIAVTLRYPVFETESRTFQIYSASMILFQNRLLVLDPDSERTLFNPLLDELKNSSRKWTVALLTTQMAAAVFRVYTDSLENFGDVLNQLEEDIIDRDNNTIFAMTAMVRKQNIFLQQTILPLKEMIFNMRHSESDLITPDLENALHTLSDQIQRIIDSAGMLSQINSGLLDIYANAQGNRMNDIMRTLTVFSVLTLPMTVISGFYGMNFVHLPGLESRYGVPVTILVMLLSALLILWYCRRKRII